MQPICSNSRAEDFKSFLTGRDGGHSGIFILIDTIVREIDPDVSLVSNGDDDDSSLVEYTVCSEWSALAINRVLSKVLNVFCLTWTAEYNLSVYGYHVEIPGCRLVTRDGIELWTPRANCDDYDEALDMWVRHARRYYQSGTLPTEIYTSVCVVDGEQQQDIHHRGNGNRALNLLLLVMLLLLSYLCLRVFMMCWKQLQ